MYTRCLNCRAFLGRNESLEPLPVGRHFAHDPARGRLWVLCRRCRNWNLAAISDDLLLPDRFDAWIQRARSRPMQPPPV